MLMSRFKYLTLALDLSMLLLLVSGAKALPSSDFTYRNGEWYDSFGINRNAYGGSDGYLPNMAYETLDANKELSYSIGESFKENYAGTNSRAEAVLRYVQTWTEYGYDSDNVVKNGAPQEEWAWNADEMAHKFDETAGIVAVGDCEDMAFLCATMYKGAGIDAAVVDAPGHVACLIWLPTYDNADYYWDLPDDSRDAGWIWVEATGSSNPLGWTPEDYSDGNWDAYPIGSSNSPPVQPEPPTELLPMELIVIGAIVVVVLLALFMAAGSKKKKTGYYSPPAPPS
jgi:hypothetical protein